MMLHFYTTPNKTLRTKPLSLSGEVTLALATDIPRFPILGSSAILRLKSHSARLGTLVGLSIGSPHLPLRTTG
jgi:hypothetical protein